MRKYLVWLCFIISGFWNTTAVVAQAKRDLTRFASGLETIREKLQIPGMAAAVMEGDSVVFAKGFGYANLKNKIRVTEQTSFRVASITKTFTSTLVMRLVEQGKLNLDDPISKYGLDLGNPRITVRNLITHTSEGEPGTAYQYNGFRYGQLGPILEKITGKPFYQLLMEEIVQPLGMSSTAMGPPFADSFRYIVERKDMKPFYDNAVSYLAKPYALDSAGNTLEIQYLNQYGAFGGLTTTAMDLLKYSSAVDRHQFINRSTQELVFTPNKTTNGAVTPYGLGWFCSSYRGLNFYWHYGQTPGESAMFLKIPDLKLTLFVTANTDKLSQPFPMGDGDPLMSPVVELFYRYFVNEDKALRPISYDQPISVLKKEFASLKNNPYKEFYNKELIVQETMDIIAGDSARAQRLLDIYAGLNGLKLNNIPKGKIIADLINVSINKELSKDFKLQKTTHLRVYGAGENCSADFSFWCDYGWIEDSVGKIVWQMPGHSAVHAGGAIKNQRVDTVIDLPAGNYKLRYKSDTGHAYNSWDSLPPDDFFWGIILLDEKYR